jgi:ATP-dependent RNA helicase DDX35
MSFWKPGTIGPGSTLDRGTEEDLIVSAPFPPSFSGLPQRERLPIFKHSEHPEY